MIGPDHSTEVPDPEPKYVYPNVDSSRTTKFSTSTYNKWTTRNTSTAVRGSIATLGTVAQFASPIASCDRSRHQSAWDVLRHALRPPQHDPPITTGQYLIHPKAAVPSPHESRKALTLEGETSRLLKAARGLVVNIVAYSPLGRGPITDYYVSQLLLASLVRQSTEPSAEISRRLRGRRLP